MNEIVIRNITKKDRDMICHIAFQTAFLGSSGTSILDDENLFFDVGILYFLLFEKANSFVAVANEKVIGYILSTYRIHIYLLINSLLIIPFIFLPKLLFFRYRIGKKTIRFFFYIFLESFLKRIPRASIHEYPAELHINLSEEARGKGIASQLMKKLIETLTNDTILGIQLNTTSENKAALKLYDRFGFAEFQKKPSIMWKKYLGSPVDNVTLVRKVDKLQ
jgi:ribosomal protein S18 acetylase RimI-like enzyme